MQTDTQKDGETEETELELRERNQIKLKRIAAEIPVPEMSRIRSFGAAVSLRIVISIINIIVVVNILLLLLRCLSLLQRQSTYSWRYSGAHLKTYR